MAIMQGNQPKKCSGHSVNCGMRKVMHEVRKGMLWPLGQKKE